MPASPAAPTGSAVLTGSAPPLTKARLLAALLSGPMDAQATAAWIARNDAVDAVDELVAAGSVRRTARGGLGLDPRRSEVALGALARDLRLPEDRRS